MDFNDDMRRWNEIDRLRRLREMQASAPQAPQTPIPQAPKPKGTIVDSLSSVLGGLAGGFKDAGKGLLDMFGTGGAAIGDLIQSGGTSTKNQDDFRKWLYNTDSTKDAAAKGLGTGISGASTLASLVAPVGTAGKVVSKVASTPIQGAVEGFADEFKYNGENANLNNALSGAVIGAVGDAIGGKVGGKLAKKAFEEPAQGFVNKALRSNAVRGAITGATAGGAGGALGSLLETPRDELSLGGVLGSAAQGATGGALGGAVSGSVMGGVDKARRKMASAYDMDNIQGSRMDKEFKADEYRESAADDLLSQYKVIPKPMSFATNPQKTVLELSDAGITKPSHVIGIANRITGANGKVSKMTRAAVSTAGRVSTDGILGEGGFLDKVIGDEYLEKDAADPLFKGIKQRFDSLPSRKRGSLDMKDDAEDVFDLTKKLRAQAAELRGRSGNNYSTTKDYKKDQATVLDIVADELEERIYSQADLGSVLTKENIDEIRNYAPNNEKWQKYVTDKIEGAKTIGELRSSVAPFVRMKRAVDAGSRNKLSLSDKLSSKEGRKDLLLGGITNSKTVRRNLADKKLKMAENLENSEGASKPFMLGNLVSRGLERPVENALGRGLGREAAIAQGRFAQNRANPEQIAYGAGLAPQATGVDALPLPASDIPSGLPMEQALGAPAQNPFNEQIAMLSGGMQNALMAGDIQAYAQMANLLGQAQKLQAMQMELSGAGQGAPELSAAQQGRIADLNNSLSSLDTLEKSFANAGGAQGFGGNLSSFANAVTGGAANRSLDSYNRLRDSIGAGIAKNLVNLGVTKEDMEAYLALLPKVTDSPEQAAQNLQTLRDLINDAKANVTSIR